MKEQAQQGEELRRRRKRRTRSVSTPVQRGVKVSPIPNQVPEKRRRRSRKDLQKPQRSTRRARFVLVSSLCLGGFLLALAYSYTLAYRNSDSYEREVESTFTELSGADVSLNKFKMDSQRATVGSVEMQWDEPSSSIRSLALNELSAQYMLGAVLLPDFIPSDIAAETGKLVIGTSSEISFKAMRVNALKNLRCESLEVHLAESDSVFVENLTASSSYAEGRTQVLFQGGVIRAGLFKDYQVQQGSFSVGRQLSTFSARLEAADGKGAVALSGEIGSVPAKPFKFSLEDMPSELVLGESLGGTHFLGRFSSTDGEWSPREHSDYSMTTAVSSDSIQLREFDCCTLLAQVLNKSAYKRPRLSTVSDLLVVKDERGYSLSNIDFEESGVLKLRGEIRCNLEGEYSGELSIGLPEKWRDTLGQSFTEEAFSRESGGYVWQRVSVKTKDGVLIDSLRSMLLNGERAEKVLDMTPDELFDQLIAE